MAPDLHDVNIGRKLPARCARNARVALALAAVLAVAGCQTIGPTSVPRDRVGYAGAIATSWKELMLLNIVKQRYLDLPVYLDVSSVISSYELSGEVNASASVFPNASAGDSRSLGARGSYAEWPTISYTPITGERLVNSLLRPIPPETVFAMISGGRRSEFILGAAVRSMNGVYSASTTSPAARPEDPRFTRVAEAIGRTEQAGGLGMRIEKRGDQTLAFLQFHRDAGADADIALIKQALGLDPARDEYRLVFGSGRRPDEIAVTTRSIQQLLGELATGVEVPDEDIRDGRATARGRVATGTAPLLRVRSGTERPADAFAAVSYRDRWFWVDDRDLAAKRMFVFLMMFTSLTEAATLPQAPMLTLPVR